MSSAGPSYAGCGCKGCKPGDTNAAKKTIKDNHKDAREAINAYTDSEFAKHKNWLTGTFAKEHVIPALKKMTEQLSAVGMHQIFTIGTFFDARQQMEMQRLFQELEFQAHRDYTPSEDFCWFGTNVRSLAHSDARARYNMAALSQRAMKRHLGSANLASAGGVDSDLAARWGQFTATYCDPKDNKWQGPGTGLETVCKAADKSRTNRDVDFTRLVEEPRTINIDFTDGALSEGGEEEDVMALANNLFGHHVLSRELGGPFLYEEDGDQIRYFWLRSIAAKRAVAENSFNAIVGLKSAGTAEAAGTGEFMTAMMKELGIPEAEIAGMIGQSPSYYAQLELLSKRIFQNPNFYANLYDKPANVKRKAVALKAVEMMLDRAIYESQLRQEMVTSVLLSSKLRDDFNKINAKLGGSGK